jgi:hypothetical protein
MSFPCAIFVDRVTRSHLRPMCPRDMESERIGRVAE